MMTIFLKQFLNHPGNCKPVILGFASGSSAEIIMQSKICGCLKTCDLHGKDQHEICKEENYTYLGIL